MSDSNPPARERAAQFPEDDGENLPAGGVEPQSGGKPDRPPPGTPMPGPGGGKPGA